MRWRQALTPQFPRCQRRIWHPRKHPRLSSKQNFPLLKRYVLQQINLPVSSKFLLDFRELCQAVSKLIRGHSQRNPRHNRISRDFFWEKTGNPWGNHHQSWGEPADLFRIWVKRVEKVSVNTDHELLSLDWSDAGAPWNPSERILRRRTLRLWICEI